MSGLVRLQTQSNLQSKDRYVPFSTVWTPESRGVGLAVPLQHPTDPFCIRRKVVRTEPGIIIQYIGDFAEEVLCTNFVRELQLPFPRLLHCPGDPSHRVAWKMPRPGDPQIETSVWYIGMGEIPVVSLDKVIDRMTPEEIDAVASRLQSIQAKIATVEPVVVGSITGDSYRNECWPTWRAPPTSVLQRLGLCRGPSTTFGPRYSALLDWRHVCCLTSRHVHVLPTVTSSQTIFFGSKTTAIIDWATAGFYAEFWEYARTHGPIYSSPRACSPLSGARRQGDIRRVFELKVNVNL